MNDKENRTREFVITFILGGLLEQGVISSEDMEETKKRMQLTDGNVGKSA